MHDKRKIIALDLGGTNLRGACIEAAEPGEIASMKITADGTVEQVLKEIFDFTDRLMYGSVEAIGIGVPGMVDAATGMVYDVQHIPSWKEVNLKALMEQGWTFLRIEWKDLFNETEFKYRVLQALSRGATARPAI